MSVVRTDVLLSRHIPIKPNFSFQKGHVKGVDASVYLTSVITFRAHLSLIIMDSRLNSLWQCFIKCRTAAADMFVCLYFYTLPHNFWMNSCNCVPFNSKNVLLLKKSFWFALLLLLLIIVICSPSGVTRVKLTYNSRHYKSNYKLCKQLLLRTENSAENMSSWPR